VKRSRGKVLMAAIILSCGFAMQAEPSAQSIQAKRRSMSQAGNGQLLTADALSTDPAGTAKVSPSPIRRNSW
jgi:hypothetical protein